jgi:hypothetical protein
LIFGKKKKTPVAGSSMTFWHRCGVMGSGDNGSEDFGRKCCVRQWRDLGICSLDWINSVLCFLPHHRVRQFALRFPVDNAIQLSCSAQRVFCTGIRHLGKVMHWNN